MSEKTEQPTEKKLREARDRGEVAKSKDFTQTLLIIALFGYIVANGDNLVASLSNFIVAPMAGIGADFRTTAEALTNLFVWEAVNLMWPFLLIVIVVGIFGETIQTGLLFAFEALKPSGKRLNVLQNAKNIFSAKNLIEFLKNNLKVLVLCVVIYLLIVDSLPLLMHIPDRGFEELGVLVGDLIRVMIINVGLAYLALALADLIWQRRQHTRQQMMSKEEVKQEYKTMEGDPLIKGQRRQLHQELLAEGAVDRSRQATVLITNPTHLAIAIVYDEATTPLPRVTAKGEGALAERMIAAARQAGVPVMRDVPLAHALFAQSDIDQYIPGELIEPVAAVLRLVQRISGGAGRNG